MSPTGAIPAPALTTASADRQGPALEAARPLSIALIRPASLLPVSAHNVWVLDAPPSSAPAIVSASSTPSARPRTRSPAIPTGTASTGSSRSRWSSASRRTST
jgi:hypothetical protein